VTSLRVRQKVSTIGQVDHVRRVIKGLGLRGPGSEVVVANTPSFRGMVKKVIHMVEVEEIKDESLAGKVRGALKKVAGAVGSIAK
jgi:large subunit ribosomal protein L30